MQADHIFSWVQGGVTAPAGFRASGIKAGIKSNKKDLALIVADCPAKAAGVFTLNRVKAAPVLLCRRRLQDKPVARAIIVNSGNANACTGRQGLEDAEAMAAVTAGLLHINPALVLVCSTGMIGLPLPMKKINPGINLAVRSLARRWGDEAAAAIMTTDTRAKQAAVHFKLGGKKITIGAMAKGAGMIAPNMATLLVFITTDAAIGAKLLQAALERAVDASFNRILVDGDQSTNDTVLCLASGLAGNKMIAQGRPEMALFQAALTAVCRKLARLVVADGEGVTKVVNIHVRGAKSAGDAEKAARAIARSLLVKTSWFGADPNWGRVICAVGYSGADVVPEKICIYYNGQAAVINGKSSGLPADRLKKMILAREFSIEVNLCLGRGSYSMLTCDCSIDYVKINADYMT